MKITKYYIDDKYVLHIYFGEEHIFFLNIFTIEEAEELINKIDNQ